MEIFEALRQLGADRVDPDIAHELDERGFVRLRRVLSPEKLEAVRARHAELLAAEGAAAGAETYTEPGADCLSDLINKGGVFHIVLTEPRVLAAVAHVLNNDMKLSSLNSRTALPGKGHQHLHADWDLPAARDRFEVCNTIWLLDDFTRDNGATRAVPGTHRDPTKTPQNQMKNPADAHPDERLLLGDAGDVFVFNGHTWHGGTLNRTNQPRRALHAYFSRRAQPPQLDQQKFLQRETWDALSPAARTILGVTETVRTADPTSR